MAETLESRLINTNPGSVYAPFPAGIAIVFVQGIWRNGVHHDKVSLADINNGGTRQWAVGSLFRIRVPDAFPFQPGEKIYVLSKKLV